MRGYEINELVAQVGKLNFSGNIIPQKWFEHLRKDSGKPDALAAIILSEIVYWYRPIEVRDEATGAIIGRQKKFKADLLQRSYDSFADQFGFTKNQVKSAFQTLKNVGVVCTHRRVVEVGGTKFGNVLFIELVPPVLAKITNDDYIDPVEKKSLRGEEISTKGCENFCNPMEEKSHTLQRLHSDYTERDSTPTETKTDRTPTAAKTDPPTAKTDPGTGIEEGTYFGMEDPRKRWNNFGRRGQIAEYNQAVPPKERTALANAFAEAYGWTGLIDGDFGDDKKLDQCHRWAIQAYQMGVKEPQRVIAAWEHWQKTDWRAVKAKEQGDDNPRPESDQLIQHISANVATKKQAEAKPKKRKVARPAGYTWGS